MDVKVIHPFPHPWWSRDDIKVGDYVRHANEDNVYKVTAIWGEGAALEALTEKEKSAYVLDVEP